MFRWASAVVDGDQDQDHGRAAGASAAWTADWLGPVATDG